MNLWFLIVINFVICCWDGYIAGVLWRQADELDSRYYRLIGGSAYVMGYIGFLYTIVLVAIVTGYVPETYLLTSNVILGLPLILSGIVITFDTFYNTYRLYLQARSTGEGWRWLILYVMADIWNLFAIFHNLSVWVNSLRMLNEIGGIKGILDSDNNKNIYAVLVIGVIFTTLIIHSLFKVGYNNKRIYR